MIRSLITGLICIAVLAGVTPLDKAFGGPCPSAAPSEAAASEDGNDPHHFPDSCPDDCHCLCCPAGRVLHERGTPARLIPPHPVEFPELTPRAVKTRDFGDGIFHPPRLA